MYHVYTVAAGENNNVIAVGVLPGRIETPGIITVLPYTFDTLEKAQAYTVQLAEHYKFLPLGNAKSIIRCEQTGETWDTVSELVKSLGCAYSQMINHVNRRPGYKSVRGRTYVKEMISAPTYGEIKQGRTPVICWQLQPDRNRFSSVKEAADALGVKASAIFRHLREPQVFQDVRGYRFSRIGHDGRPVNYDGTPID